MESLALPLKFLLAFILGGLIGLEREVNEKKDLKPGKKPIAILGLRSFSLIAVLGSMSAVLYTDQYGLSLLLTASFFLLLIVFYVFDSSLSKDFGVTTEIAAIYSFLIGVFLILEVLPIQLILALTVVLLLLLSKKDHIKNLVDDISKKEVNAFISYAIVALVILPFLPNTTYSVSDIPTLAPLLENFGVNIQRLSEIDIINPFKVWLIVALITGIDLIGYILERTVGQKRGWILASIAGGFVSSTATTQSLAQQSKQSKRINHLIAAAIVANLVSFFQIALLIAPLNTTFLFLLFPTLLAIIVTALFLAFYFLHVKKEPTQKQKAMTAVKKDKVFNLAPALKFASLYILISIISKVALTLFGQSGFLVATGIGALIGLDAVMINTAQLAGENVSFTIAVVAFILANGVNLLGKSVYSFLQGERSFAIKFSVSMLLLIGASLLGLLFVS